MKRSYSGYLYIVLCAVIFSTMEVMLKNRSRCLRTHAITCLRFLIAVSARSLCPALDEEKGRRLYPRRRRLLCAHGLSVRGVLDGALPDGGDLHKASVVAIIFSCNPIFVTVLAYFLLREEIHRNHLVALALELLAVLIIIDRCTPRSIPPARCSPLPQRWCFRSTA